MKKHPEITWLAMSLLGIALSLWALIGALRAQTPTTTPVAIVLSNEDGLALRTAELAYANDQANVLRLQNAVATLQAQESAAQTGLQAQQQKVSTMFESLQKKYHAEGLVWDNDTLSFHKEKK